MEGKSLVLTLETAERGWPLSFCTFICSPSRLVREPAVCQMLLRCWGDGDEYRDGGLAPSSSPMSTGWRAVREPCTRYFRKCSGYEGNRGDKECGHTG